jgi:hypothetical protein
MKFVVIGIVIVGLALFVAKAHRARHFREWADD